MDDPTYHFKFTPKEDITVFELARLTPLIVKAGAHANYIRHSEISFQLKGNEFNESLNRHYVLTETR